jgi:hypothetical protein
MLEEEEEEEEELQARGTGVNEVFFCARPHHSVHCTLEESGRKLTTMSVLNKPYSLKQWLFQCQK